MNPDPARFLSLLLEDALLSLLDESQRGGGLSINPDDDIVGVDRNGMMAAVQVTFRGGPAVIVEVNPA